MRWLSYGSGDGKREDGTSQVLRRVFGHDARFESMNGNQDEDDSRIYNIVHDISLRKLVHRLCISGIARLYFLDKGLKESIEEASLHHHLIILFRLIGLLLSPILHHHHASPPGVFKTSYAPASYQTPAGDRHKLGRCWSEPRVVWRGR